MSRVFFLIGLFLLLGTQAWGKGPSVVASIYPLYEILREVGGKYVSASLLLPPGADPHSWEPTPKDLLLLQKASLIFVVGKGLEPWLEDIIKSLPKVRILRAADSAPLLFLKGHRIDPHLWLDFKWDASLALRLGKALAQIDPFHREVYLRRAQNLRERFLHLDQTYRQTLANCKSKYLLVAGHNAFGYWERAYGLKVISLAGTSPEAEPTPRALAQALRLIKKNRIKAVFYEEPSSRRFAELLAKEAGLNKVLYLTPGASLPREELQNNPTFFDLMERNLHHLAEGLSCPLPTNNSLLKEEKGLFSFRGTEGAFDVPLPKPFPAPLEVQPI